MKFDINLWISVALAIPLAIIANLLTPRIRMRMDNRAERSKKRRRADEEAQRKKQLEEMQSELDEIRNFRVDGGALRNYLLICLVKVAFYGAFARVYATLLNFVGEFGSWNEVPGILARSGNQMIWLFAALLIYRVCSEAMKSCKKVKDYEGYEKFILGNITELKGGTE